MPLSGLNSDIMLLNISNTTDVSSACQAEVIPLLRFPHEALLPGNFGDILDQQSILGLLYQCQAIRGDDRSSCAWSLLP